MKRGNLWGGDALKVAKPVSPPHTPPLRARCCSALWWAEGYWRGDGCEVELMGDGKAARGAGLFPGMGGNWSEE